MKHILFIQSMVGAALLTGCATASVPQERIIASQSAVRAAEEVGAEKVPSAALHLQLAREGIQQAQRLIKQKENNRAGYALMRAEADAELAVALARESPLRDDAQQALEKLQNLKQSNTATP